ncbi:sec-independent protein translocase protein TatC [Desulfitispora alkaliphila]|uniref:twin-arginine translocase subunit TatC n=1 Tax=Desulfitispora alkaliphila TaxID=622674 RepID=UPI003D19C800
MDKKISLVEHLQDLRKSIVISIVALVIGCIIGFTYAPLILEFLKKPLPVQQMAFFNPVEAFLVNLKVAVLVGFVLAFPVIISSFAWFVAPGLTKKEKKIISILSITSVLLFIFGAVIATLAAMPIALKFLFEFSPEIMQPYISIQYYYSFFITFILVFGLSFQLPIILLALAFLGIIDHLFLKKNRKYVLLAIFSLSIMLAPGTELLSQLILFVPLYLLYEITILVLKFISKKSLTTEVN